MIFSKFKNRTLLPEIMDDFDLEGEMLSDALVDLAWVNRWLGGNHISIQGIQQWISTFGQHFTDPIRIADIGCGGGDTLREIAKIARKKGWKVELTGIDANAFTVAYATKASESYPEIHFVQADVLDESCRLQDYDVLLCGLFLHHLTNEELDILLTRAKSAGVSGMVVNDLQRNPLAYYGFQAISLIQRPSDMAKQDGLVSILRSFRRRELIAFMKKHTVHSYQIRWKWAFRYLLVFSFHSDHRTASIPNSDTSS